MTAISAVTVGVFGVVVAGLGIVQLVTAQKTDFSAESRTFADVTSTFGGTWTLKQRTNPDGTPYRSKLEGVTYVSMRAENGATLGPHAVATVHSTESGVLDNHFFEYSKEVVGKPFRMETTGTWLIHNLKNLDAGAEISARVYAMTKGSITPYTSGVVMSADVRYNVTRKAPRAGAAAAPRMELMHINAGELTDFAGNKIAERALVGACCGMTNLVVTQDSMEIDWSNKGKDLWVKSAKTVPAAFR